MRAQTRFCHGVYNPVILFERGPEIKYYKSGAFIYDKMGVTSNKLLKIKNKKSLCARLEVVSAIRLVTIRVILLLLLLQ